MTDRNDVVQVMADVIAPDNLLWTAREREREAQRIIDALHAAGWRIVPYEPTEDMLRATQPGLQDKDCYRDDYQAMLDTSPGQTQEKE